MDPSSTCPLTVHSTSHSHSCNALTNLWESNKKVSKTGKLMGNSQGQAAVTGRSPAAVTMVCHRHAEWSAWPGCSKTAWLKIKIKPSRIGFRWGQGRRLLRGSLCNQSGSQKLSLFCDRWLPSQCGPNSRGDLGASQGARWLNTGFLVPPGNFSQRCKFTPEQRTVTFSSIRKRHILKVWWFFFSVG